MTDSLELALPSADRRTATPRLRSVLQRTVTVKWLAVDQWLALPMTTSDIANRLYRPTVRPARRLCTRRHVEEHVSTRHQLGRVLPSNKQQHQQQQCA